MARIILHMFKGKKVETITGLLVKDDFYDITLAVDAEGETEVKEYKKSNCIINYVYPDSVITINGMRA